MKKILIGILQSKLMDLLYRVNHFILINKNELRVTIVEFKSANSFVKAVGCNRQKGFIL